MEKVRAAVVFYLLLDSQTFTCLFQIVHICNHSKCVVKTRQESSKEVVRLYRCATVSEKRECVFLTGQNYIM